MPNNTFFKQNQVLLDSLRESGQYKHLHYITGPMGPTAHIEGKGEVVVLCSNNYLGLASHPEVIAAGIEGLHRYGAGTASVRFICGTLTCHREIEEAIARFVGAESALTYVSGWTANEGLIPTVATEKDVIISDELNHASIIDAARLAKNVPREIYRHSDMADLENKLKAHNDKLCRWVITDGVFSMEGDVVNLPVIINLCKQYDAMLIIDDAHGVGVLGGGGRGTPEYFGLLGQVDILTGTLGKALGGAAGGYVAANPQVIELLVQRSRPSLFSNALPATVACSARKAIEIIESEPQRVHRLHENIKQIRDGLAHLGFELHESPTAIIPIIIGDAAEAVKKSERLMELGIMVIAFSYPVVPRGQARLRVQVSAALEQEHIDKTLDAFTKL